MFIEIAALTFLAGQFIYHRWIEDKPTKKEPPREIQIPRIDPGATVPIIYGRVRARAPALVWHGSARSQPGDVSNGAPDAAIVYQMNALYVVGIPFGGARASTSQFHGMWAGDTKFNILFPLAELPRGTYDGGGPIQIFHGGQVEFLDGDTAQDIDTAIMSGCMQTNPDDPLTTSEIPGYRGYLSVGLHAGTASDLFRWQFGEHSTVPSYSFEVSSYHNTTGSLSLYPQIGADSNPINALYDLLTSPFGGLGLSSSLIDLPSFGSAAYTMHIEQHGYSRCIEDGAEADEHIMDILKQIDGALRHNTTTNKIEIKLIRNDYDPTTIPHITRDNAEKIVNFAAAGWSNLNNKIEVVYTDRSNDYQDNSVTDENQANASSQDIKNPLVLQYPGVCTEALAQRIAERELAARSRPLIKMRAIVGREFIRVAQGDAVKVTWTNPDIAGLIFRVANVERGTLENGAIALDLIQDFFYVWNNSTPLPPLTETEEPIQVEPIDLP